MPLQVGARLGPYEVVSLLGSGGMGEVYRAKDTKLGRDVAIKVVLEAFAVDPERVARFQREAQLLAALNHPHIGAIYGLEQADSSHFLVLELVEGETLADRLRRGPLPVEAALHVGQQIAAALEAAHEKGVVHRDLKPANVKITPDEQVKVLDFGLAKAVEPSSAASNASPTAAGLTHSPTLSVMATQAGMILGTAAYMSPEQAKGLSADHRSDVFSFGVVFYEMLTGRQPFQGETAPDVLASVLVREPDLAVVPPNLNPRVVDMLKRCLDKNPKRRWQAVGDLRAEIEAIAVAPRSAPTLPQLGTNQQPLWRRAVPFLAATVVIAVVAGVSGWNLKPSVSVPAAVTRFSVILPDDLQFIRTSAPIVAVTLDGSRIAYVGNRQIFVRSMSDMEARPIPGTSGLDPSNVFFSPDGQWVGFYSVSEQALKKVAVSGGAALTICKLGPNTVGIIQGPSWDGDQIVFAREGKGVMRVSANGGEPEVLVPVEAPQMAYGPQVLPGGKSVLFSLATEQGADRWDRAQVVVQSLTSTERKIIVRGGSAARYVPTGHLLYALGGTLLAIPFDIGTLEGRGGPVPLLEGIRRANSTISGVAQFAVSMTGSLVTIPGSSLEIVPETLALVDRAGKVQPLGLPPQPYYHPRVSPDGKQMVFGTDDGKESIVWVADLKVGASARRLTFGGRNMYPLWSRDGHFITFQSDREGDRALFRQPADGSGTAERLTKPEGGAEHRPEDWNPDGKTLLFLDAIGNGNLWTLSLDGDRKPKPLVQLPSNDRYAVFSPDGRWFAYGSTEIGNRFEVFVQPFPTTGAKYQISTGGGRDPLWSPDGKEIFYNTVLGNAVTGSTAGGPGKLVAVEVRTQPTFNFGRPVSIPIERAILGSAQRYYDITPDGKEFLVVIPPDGQGEPTRRSSQQINVVLNWFEELKTRVPTK